MSQNGLAVLSEPIATQEQVGSITTTKRKRTAQRVQAAMLQNFAFESAMAMRENCFNAETGKLVMDPTTAVCVHKLIGAWDTAGDRLRILRGKGLPASTKPVAPKRAAEMKPID